MSGGNSLRDALKHDYKKVIWNRAMLKRYIIILKEVIDKDPWLFIEKTIMHIIELICLLIGLLLPKYLIIAMSTGDKIIFAVSLLGSVFINLTASWMISAISPNIVQRDEILKGKFFEEFLQKSLKLRVDYFDVPNAYDQYVLVLS